MANLDGEKIRGLVRGLTCGDEDTTSKARADQFSVGRFLGPVSLALSANTTGSATAIPRLDRPIRVKALRMASSAAQASDATNNWTFALKYDDGAGGASSTVMSYTTNGNAITANTTFSTTGLVDVAAGKRLFVVGTAAGSTNALTIVFSAEFDET